MLPDASLADIMAKLDAIELWDKIGEKDKRKAKGLNVGLWEEEGGRSRRGPEGPPTGFASQEGWVAHWAKRDVDTNALGCGIYGSHGHRKDSCPENRRYLRCPYCQMPGHMETACFSKMADEVAGQKRGGSQGANLVREEEATEGVSGRGRDSSSFGGRESDSSLVGGRESDSSPVGSQRSPMPCLVRKSYRVKVVSRLY